MKKLKLVALFLFCALAVQPVLHTIWLWSIVFDNDRAWKMFLSFDKFGNAAVNGDPAETVSLRAARGMANGSRGWCILCRVLDFFDKNHCEKLLPAVDGVRPDIIQESSDGENANDQSRAEPGVLPVPEGQDRRGVRSWFSL